MIREIRKKLSPKPQQNSQFSEFIRNASAGEKKKVYERVMRKAIEKQRKIMECAENETHTG